MFLAHWWKIRFTNTPRSWLVSGSSGRLPFHLPLAGRRVCRGTISIRSAWAKNGSRIRFHGCEARLVYCVGLLVCWTPQMAQWKIIYGKYVTLPQGGGLFSFPPTHMLSVLFSSQNGWFMWTPLVFVGSGGSVFALPNHARDFCPGSYPRSIEWTVVGSMYWWHGMDSFSARYMLSATPLVALGLAALMASVSQGGAKRGSPGRPLLHFRAFVCHPVPARPDSQEPDFDC